MVGKGKLGGEFIGVVGVVGILSDDFVGMSDLGGQLGKGFGSGKGEGLVGFPDAAIEQTKLEIDAGGVGGGNNNFGVGFEVSFDWIKWLTRQCVPGHEDGYGGGKKNGGNS